jgi:nucleotide-binding universal stress UspA family protein
VVVCAALPSFGQSLLWAAAEACRREAPLHVLLAGAQRSTVEHPSKIAEALRAIRDAFPDLPVLGHPSRGPVPDALRELSADAGALVVPASLPGLESVVADSYCPVFALPDDAAIPAAEHGPVALGVAPWTSEETIDLSFREAALRCTRLIAVRTWSDPQLSLSRLRPDQLFRWDRADDRARHELELALSAWHVAHPDVQVETIVVQDRTADFLLSLSRLAQLLVVGRSTRGTLLAGIAGSPVSELLHGSRCPVLVVPAEGPPRTTWLPSRSDGWAFTQR